ncbi:MAG: metallophosphoesterase [Clostridia bacterium]|nr:metallophosphoesterase [Clostridia bacterium]
MSTNEYMSTRKKIFAVSDIHGHSSLFREALAKAGFRRDDPEHLLVVCGDYFDRGSENRAVYNYLDSLKNKVLIRGNHDENLDNILLNGKLTLADHMNGTEKTVIEFFRGDYIPEFNFVYTDEKCDGYRELRPFLDGLYDYFETEHYIFAHGWLPIEPQGEDGIPSLAPDWRYATPAMWHGAVWTEWNKVYPYRPMPQGKTIIVGHRGTDHASAFDPERPKGCSEPFFGEGMIAIDALTVVSGRVNILVLEDEITEPRIHEMKLLDTPFTEMRRGRKTVEMRLFDPKRQLLRQGDLIRFTNESSGEKLTVKVIGLHRFDDFFSLTSAFTPRALGSANKKSADIAGYMSGIYDEDQIRKYGTLAIRVSLV